MAEPDTTSNQLQIRCPKCGQRFKVGNDLRGKLVECGSCEQRFRVNDEVILRSRKFYPGEAKRDGSLDRFARAPLSTAGPVDFETANYNPNPDTSAVEPPSVQHIMAGAVGVGLIVFVLLLFIVSSGDSGPLGDVSTEGRMVLVLFIGVIGSSFILYANRRRLIPTAIGCLVACGLLLSMPLIFPGPDDSEVQQRPPDPGTKPAAPISVIDSPAEAKGPYDEIKELIRYGPVEAAIAEADAPEQVIAIWLRDMQERHKWTVEEYLLRVTGAEHSSHLYPRGDQGFLMVLTGMQQEIEETAQLCKRIGSIDGVRVIRPLRVIEVHLDAGKFTEATIEELSDADSDRFYALNLNELESIDLGRVERAVQRLTGVEPKMRSDIAGRMIELLAEVSPELCSDIAAALIVWAEPEDGADQAVLDVARRIDSKGKKVDEGILRFLVKRQVSAVQPFLHKCWIENPDSWANETLSIKESAVRVLGKVGNASTIPVLEAIKDGRDPDFDASITRSITVIRSRASGADAGDPPSGP